jgi:hypothetical protein
VKGSIEHRQATQGFQIGSNHGTDTEMRLIRNLHVQQNVRVMSNFTSNSKVKISCICHSQIVRDPCLPSRFLNPNGGMVIQPVRDLAAA